MKSTLSKSILRGLLIAFFVTLLIASYGYVNSLFCSYQLKITHSPTNQIDLTCRVGKVSVLHTEDSKTENTVALWRISARQLLFGNQLVFLVWDRERIGGPLTSETAAIDDYNYSVKDFSTLFYFVKRSDNQLTIFEKFPDHDVYTGEIKGKIGLIEPN